MKIFGIKSILIMIVFYIVVFFLFVEYEGASTLIFAFIAGSILFSKIIVVNGNSVVFLKLSPSFRRKIKLSDVSDIVFKGGGTDPGLTTIYFNNEKNEKLNSIFLLLYSFERKQMAKFFSEQGIQIGGNDIQVNKDYLMRKFIEYIPAIITIALFILMFWGIMHWLHTLECQYDHAAKP